MSIRVAHNFLFSFISEKLEAASRALINENKLKAGTCVNVVADFGSANNALACMAGVERGRGRGNLGARESVCRLTMHWLLHQKLFLFHKDSIWY